MREQKHGRIPAILLCLALLIQLLPVGAFAVDREYTTRYEQEMAGVDQTIPNTVPEEEPEDQPAAYVLGEMTERRGQTEKHFRMSDGSFIAVDYGMPVHYSTDSGETWNDIDNTLTLCGEDRGGSEKEVYAAENGDSTRAFARSLDSGFLFSVRNGEYGVRTSLTDGLRGAEAPEAEISYPDAKDAEKGSENDKSSLSDQIAPARLRTEIVYRGVLDGVDLRYELCGGSVKETILVSKPLGSYSFSFCVELDALTPALAEDGSVELKNAEGETVYLIPAPYMYDAAGETSDAVHYTLTQTDGSWTLAVTADAAWINDEARTFPVSIDPTVIDVVTWTGQGGGVTHVVQGEPNQTHANYQMISVGYDNSGPLETQIYFGVDTLPTVPAGSDVIGAMLALGKYTYNNAYPFDHVGVNEIAVELHEITTAKPTNVTNANWVSTFKWNNTNNSNPALNIAVTDDTVLEYTRLAAGDTDRYDTWDMTALAKKWYREKRESDANSSLPAPTMVGCLRVNDPSQFGYNHYANVRFCGYGTYGPILIVTYRDTVGLEPYYTYQTLSAGRAGAAYVSDYTGALTVQLPLAAFASTVNPVSLGLVYNSEYFTESDEIRHIPAAMGYGCYMGSGVKLNLLQKVEYVDLQNDLESGNTQRYVKYTDGDGTSHYFRTDAEKQAQEPSGSTTFYYDEDGLGLKVTEYATDSFRMLDDKDNQMVFIHGYLTTIQDSNGNQIQLFFRHSDGTMSTDGHPNASGDRLELVKQKNNGQSAVTVITLGYDTGTNLLRSVTDYAGNVCTLQYDGNRFKRILWTAAGEQTSSTLAEYEYAGSGSRMTGMKDMVEDYALHLTYDDGRISGFSERAGSVTGGCVTAIRVQGEKTSYIDWGLDRALNTTDDITTTYLFDHAGRTVNAYSTDSGGTILGATNAVYDEAEGTNKKKNRIGCTASIGTVAMPLLSNGNFERADASWTLSLPSTNAATIYSSEHVRTGEKALKLWIGQNAFGSFTASQTTDTLLSGRTYTASVYVRTVQASIRNDDPGIYLEVTDGTNTYTGDDLKYVTDSEIDDGWQRISVTFTAQQTVAHTARIRVSGMKGIMYFDDFQLELGGGPSDFNLLQNGGLTCWQEIWKDETGAAASFEANCSVQGSGNTDYALKIVGDPEADKSVWQTVSVNLPGTQTYVLSGWAKANAVPDNLTTATGDDAAATDTDKQFGLRAILTYSDNTTEYHYVPFNPDVKDWQFTSLTIVPKEAAKTVATIHVICAYERNANTAYFDNLSLVRETAQTMHYDEDGNLDAVNSTGTAGESSTYDNGNLIQVVTGGSGTFDYTYDNRHNLTEATNGTVKETYTRDPDTGNITAATLEKADGTSPDAQKIHSAQTYTNEDNLVASVTGANGETVSYTYGNDASVMRGQPTKTTDPKGTSAVTNYDARGRVKSSWISGYVALNYTYDANGRLTSVRRGGYNSNMGGGTAIHQWYGFTYNAFGQTLSVSIGENGEHTLAGYTYAPNGGLLTQMTYGNGDTVSYTYDTLGRKTQTQTSDGDLYTYAYTGDGQLFRMADGSGGLVYNYSYDSLGRLIGSSVRDSSTVGLQTFHRYDDNNRLVSQTWALPGKTYQEGFTYDSYGRLAAKNVTLPNGTNGTSANIGLSYDSLSRLWETTSPVAEVVYNFAPAMTGTGTTGAVSQMSVNPVTGLTGNNIFSRLYYKYTYDENGNITQIQELAPNNAVIDTTVYTYDNQGQLTNAASTANGTWSYQYDTYGNIRSWTHGTESCAYTYGDAVWKDLLTGLSVTRNGVTTTGSYVYDGSGNPTTYFSPGDLSTWTMSWKNGRELATATDGTHSLSCDYDVDGLRTYKVVDGVRHDYVYASGQLLRETWTQSGTTYILDFVYDHAGRPYILNVTTTGSNAGGPTPYYYLLNLQGDVVGMVDANGNTAATYTYDAWGAVLTATGSLASINPLRYRGYYYDTETGFYYLQSRYYDPVLKRFINADGYASTGTGFLGYNMFAYCENGVVNRLDRHGNLFIETHPISDLTENGFNVDITKDFLYPEICLYYAMELVDTYGDGSIFCGMTAERIAMEIFAHAVLYYSGKCIMPSKIQKISEVGAYLVEKGNPATVNYDEYWYRRIFYQELWDLCMKPRNIEIVKKIYKENNSDQQSSNFSRGGSDRGMRMNMIY